MFRIDAKLAIGKININLLIVLYFITGGCNNAAENPATLPASPAFILGTNEQLLLSDSSCNISVSLDSIQSFSRLSSIKREALHDDGQATTPICIGFRLYFQNGVDTTTTFIQSVPSSYGLIPDIIPSHSILIISVLNKDFIHSIKGNEFYSGKKLPVDSMYHYVKRLFLAAADTSKYGDKRVTINFPSDNTDWAPGYLTQLVIGYIEAQKILCKTRFGKELKHASLQEIVLLRKAVPLRFTLLKRKLN
jgi:hypothetical protein